MNRRRLSVLVLVVLSAVTLAGAPAASATATWVSAPAVAPPPPAGASPAPYPVGVGFVGDIEFWAPNRGLLITAGAGIVPAGLYAYDGATWHQLSTVCGGTDGRIAWAGPEEFWTIADQRPGQTLPTGGASALENLSLCHFVNGQVVGSYAMPLGQPNSYSMMTSAACGSPSDCWFGGITDASGGAFHLYWNGSTLTQTDGPADHAVASMSADNGQVYESVSLARTDSFAGESATNPPVLHLIDPGQSKPFEDLFPIAPPGCSGFDCQLLPDYGAYGANVDPVTLTGLSLSSDWHAAGVTDPQLWAIGGTNNNPAAGKTASGPIAMFYRDGNWRQVVPDLVTFPNGDTPTTGPVLNNLTPFQAPQAIAADPGEPAAWVSVAPGGLPDPDRNGHVDKVTLSPDLSTATVSMDVTLGTPQGIGPKGAVSAITCPATDDCWAATTNGWLFHLTDGTQLPQDTDPNFAGVITFRPADSGVPQVTESGAAGADPTPLPQPTAPTFGPPPTRRTVTKRLPPVVTHLGRPRVVHRTTLELSFTLSVRARVQLVAKRHRVVVAQTRVTVFAAGRHTVHLVLDAHRWPTALALNAKAFPGAKKKSSSSSR